MTVQDLPVLNACLNGFSCILLVAAYLCIRRRKIRAHAWLIICALVTSAAFLASYVTYHTLAGHRSSKLPEGLFRTSYLSMLFSHIVLAVVMLPMILTALWRAYRRDWVRHRRIAVPTFWIWLYVSVTGVLIYLILYHLVPALYPDGPIAGMN